MSGKKLNVLVVDDNDAVRTLIEDILDSEGHTVVSASDGRGGLDAAHYAIFDVAVVDYNMPAPNGLELLDRLRRIQPNCVGLLVSGSLDLPTAIGAVNRGEVARIVPKPFTVKELLNAIHDGMEMRQRMAEQYLWSSAMEHSEQERCLRECFAENRFRLALQPIVSVTRRDVVAYEALLRCNHEVLTGPAQVLAAAETHGRLPQLGAVIVAQAAEALKVVAPHAGLFINLHPIELDDPAGLLDRLAPLEPHASRVVLEITERSKMKDAGKWRDSTDQLRARGYSIAVDDLGAGYSSLSVLAELRPRFIKIDMSIVRGCDEDDHKRRLIELVCRFSESADAQVVAEGIETREESATVVQAGAHLLQGYLLGRPELVSRATPVPGQPA